MTFTHAANYRHRVVCAGSGTGKSQTLAGFLTQVDLTLFRQPQFKKDA